MIDLNTNKKEKAILVAVKSHNISRDLVQEHIAELEELANTAGAETIIKIIQEKNNIDSAFYIGKGKVQEVALLAEQNNIDLIIFDDDLSPVQIRNLEKLINKKIVDRSSLILDIFASHAKTKEAKTQVELAQLQYLLPRLTRAWTHLSKQYGGIGTKGPGETQIETDRRIVRDRIIMLREKLQKIESQRKTQTQNRKDIFRIAIVGYTNAGKSTLFNLLTKSDVLAEDKLFATLDSTTRTFEIAKNDKILISDTVGFIRKLPTHLVASFKSTLSEVVEANIILHIIDFSHPYCEDHILVVDDTLKSLNCESKPQIKVFNKVDQVDDKSKIEYTLNKYDNSVIISASRGINISKLTEKINENYEVDYQTEKIKLGLNESKLVSRIHSLASVLSTKYNDDSIYITYRTNRDNSQKIKKLIHH